MGIDKMMLSDCNAFIPVQKFKDIKVFAQFSHALGMIKSFKLKKNLITFTLLKSGFHMLICEYSLINTVHVIKIN